MKKVFSLVAVLFLSMMLFACDEVVDPAPDPDTTPPAFIGAVGGKLSELTHLAGEEIDLLQGVVARDNIPDAEVTVVISNFDGYDFEVAGEYTITITATDESNNSASVTRKIIVLETIVRQIDAIVIGDDFTEYTYNNPEALMYTTSGTAFRSFEIVQVMEKQVFIDQFNQYKATHTNNGQVPFFLNGVIAIVDTDFNVQLVRLGQTTPFEMDSEGNITTEELTWSNTLDAVNGGGMFKGILEALEDAIPDGGYLMFTGNFGFQTGRMFLMRNFFFSNYEGGLVDVSQFDADYPNMTIELVEGFTQVIAKPDPIGTPVLSIERHVLKWDAVPHAVNYQIFVDGELTETTTQTSFALALLELEITGATEDPYSITVKAISQDIYQWSSSLISEEVLYTMIEISPIDAPEITIDGGLLEWAPITGADSYEVYVTVGGLHPTGVLVASTLDTVFDLSLLDGQFLNNVKLTVMAIGDDAHYDSVASNVLIHYVGEKQQIVFDDITVDLAITNVDNYFARRNTPYATDQTGFAGYPAVLMIEDAYNILTTTKTVSAAFSFVVLLNENNEPKLIRSIFAKQSWTAATGWIADDEVYVNNGIQLAGINAHLAPGDKLLMFRNTIGFGIQYNDANFTVNIRDIGAHLYAKSWGAMPTETWRDFGDFTSPTDVTFTIESKPIVIPGLDTPVVALDNDLLTWDAVDSAESYDIVINVTGLYTDHVAASTTDLFYDLSALEGDYHSYVNVSVVATHSTMADSGASNKLLHFVGEQQEIVFGNVTVGVMVTTVDDYFSRRNTIYTADKTGYSGYPAVFLIEDAYNILTTTKTVTENAGFIVLLDSEGNVKLVRSVFTNQWTIAGGWVLNDPQYTSNSAQLANISGYLAEGDQLLIFRHTAGVEITYNGDVLTTNTRDIGAHLFAAAWGAVPSETWRDAMSTFTNPSSITFTIQAKN